MFEPPVTYDQSRRILERSGAGWEVVKEVGEHREKGGGEKGERFVLW